MPNMNKDSILRMKAGNSSAKGGGGGGSEGGAGWEVRPCGMLVQRRSSDSHQSSVHIPTIKVRVKFNSCYHEVSISSQASFGELKKILSGKTGLQPQDQKLIYKDKERDSKVFLDVAGVRDGSRIILVEDELSIERRRVETRKNSKMEKASKDIASVRFDVDKLAKQVASIELEINSGKKVVETVLLNLIELLMTQLIKLDGISAEGDVKMQRRMQVKRVQKYIETLDMLKIRNSSLNINGTKAPLQHKIFTSETILPNLHQKEQRNHMNFNGTTQGSVVTTKWETF